MSDPKSVYEALEHQGLVKREDVIHEEYLQIQSSSGSHQWCLSTIESKDLETFAVELDNSLAGRHPAFQNLFIRNAVYFTFLIRASNVHSFQGFKGSRSMGNELDAVPLGADLFQDPDATSNVDRLSWRRQVPGPGTMQFICDREGQGPNNYYPLRMREDEAIGILGFLNPARDPCSDAVQVEMDGLRGPLERLDFAMPGPVQVETEEVPDEPPQAAVQQPEEEQGGSLADIFRELEQAEVEEARRGPVPDAKSSGMSERRVRSIASRLVKALMAITPRNSTLVACRRPVFVFPFQNILINVHYSKAGWDELKPIGLWVKPAKNLR